MLALAACSDNGSDSDRTAPTSGNGNAPEAPSSELGIGSCSEVDQAALDVLIEGLELTDDAPAAGAELQCVWESPAGDGVFQAQLQIYDGRHYYGEELYDDVTPIELCDRAFTSSDIGTTIQFLSGDTMVQATLAQILVPADEAFDDGTAAQRVEAFARAVAAEIC